MNKLTFLFIILMYFLGTSSKAISKNNEKRTEENAKTALLIIDIQNFYFPGGSLPLNNPELAAQNAKKILDMFREKGMLVVYIKHNTKSGSEIYELLTPNENEKVIIKNDVNSFLNTDLLDYLNKNNIKNLVLCGMQTHMCLEAATRAASDYGFNCTVIEDACTTRDLTFENYTIAAKDVHLSTLSTLNKTYAKIIKTDEFLSSFQ